MAKKLMPWMTLSVQAHCARALILAEKMIGDFDWYSMKNFSEASQGNGSNEIAKLSDGKLRSIFDLMIYEGVIEPSGDRYVFSDAGKQVVSFD